MILNKKHVFTPHSTIQNNLSGTKKNGMLQVQTKNKIIHCDKQFIDMCKTLKHSSSETHSQSCTCMLADCQWAHSRLAVGFQGCKTLCMKLKCVKKIIFSHKNILYAMKLE